MLSGSGRVGVACAAAGRLGSRQIGLGAAVEAIGSVLLRPGSSSFLVVVVGLRLLSSLEVLEAETSLVGGLSTSGGICLSRRGSRSILLDDVVSPPCPAAGGAVPLRHGSLCISAVRSFSNNVVAAASPQRPERSIAIQQRTHPTAAIAVTMVMDCSVGAAWSASLQLASGFSAGVGPTKHNHC